MKFRTTCAHCESVFLLTAEQLDAAQGWAQCSVCGAAFDARAALTAENGEPLPLEIETPIVEEVADSVTDSPSASGIPGEAPTAYQTADQTEPASDQNEPATPPSEHAVPQLHGIENRMGGPDLTSIILIDPDAQVTDDYGPLPVFATASPAATDSVYRPDYSDVSVVPQQFIETLAAPTPASARIAQSRRRIPGAIWGLLSGVLTLALLAQLSYFLRDTLASQAPATRPWLEAACAPLGCKLGLPKDTALIQIIGSDLQAEPASKNQLKLKLTLGNRAAYAQAWPVLVLTLTDRNDQAQARRSFAPSEYLSDQALLDSGIQAQSEHPLTLPLEVRNLTLAGYHLEVTY
ncbi:MAG: zinc-ribbon and DUF3426 domain-containing protein [Thiobacillaceae bacterium]